MKALTRLEAEAYLIKFMRAGAEAQLEDAEKMIKSCTDKELVDVFEAITGQGLILPAVSDRIIHNVEGHNTAREEDTGTAEGTAEDEGD